MLSAIYGPSGSGDGAPFWNRIQDVRRTFVALWLILGHMDGTLEESKRFLARGSSSALSASRPFLRAANNLGLGRMEIHLVEWKSWVEPFKSQIGCALLDTDWRAAFPSATLFVLPDYFSDHRPLLLISDWESFARRDFKFEGAWT